MTTKTAKTATKKDAKRGRGRPRGTASEGSAASEGRTARVYASVSPEEKKRLERIAKKAPFGGKTSNLLYMLISDLLARQ